MVTPKFTKVPVPMHPFLPNSGNSCAVPDGGVQILHDPGWWHSNLVRFKMVVSGGALWPSPLGESGWYSG